MKRNKIKIAGCLLGIVALCGVLQSCGGHSVAENESRKDVDTDSLSHIDKEYKVVEMSTPNVDKGINEVKGIVLHHTATASLEESIEKLTTPGSGVSCHVLIDKDGTRYLLAPPEAITWHAGFSKMGNREKCNKFTIGIEFQGNTVEEPLSEEQVESAVEYIVPLMEEYGIPIENIVTHEQIRKSYQDAHPKSGVPDKVDITESQHQRILNALQLQNKAPSRKKHEMEPYLL